MTQPTCPYCGTTTGLRKLHDGYGSVPPEYTCEADFTPRDDGPCFDDLQPYFPYTDPDNVMGQWLDAMFPIEKDQTT